MIRRCDVYENDRAVGTVTMGRRGLYWAISCRCEPEAGRGKRLVAVGDFGRIDLGRLYPIEGSFGLETSVAVKTLGEGKSCFSLAGIERKEQYIALDPEREFPCLCMLEQCRFCIRDGKACVILPQKK